MKSLCSFYPDEVLKLFEVVKPALLRGEGRGRKSKYLALDRFLITLAHLKHAQNFNKTGLDYDLDPSVANTMFY